jgi:hypothetical protein
MHRPMPLERLLEVLADNRSPDAFADPQDNGEDRPVPPTARSRTA